MARSKSRSRRKQQQTFDWKKYLPYAALALVAVLVLGAIVIFSGEDTDEDTASDTSNQAQTDNNTDNSAPVGANAGAPILIDGSIYQSQFDGTDHILLDVRTPGEYTGATGHIADSVNIDEQIFTTVQDAEAVIQSQLGTVPKDEPIVVYCNSGRRSGIVTDMLARAGYTNVYDLGGIQQWMQQGLPTVR